MKNEIKKIAKEFLEMADKLNEQVSNYIDGSNNIEDIKAYEIVKELDKKLVDLINAREGYRCYEYGLNYELAEAVL